MRYFWACPECGCGVLVATQKIKLPLCEVCHVAFEPSPLRKKLRKQWEKKGKATEETVKACEEFLKERGKRIKKLMKSGKTKREAMLIVQATPSLATWAHQSGMNKLDAR